MTSAGLIVPTQNVGTIRHLVVKCSRSFGQSQSQFDPLCNSECPLASNAFQLKRKVIEQCIG